MKVYGLDARSIGLFRIFLGVSILYDLVYVLFILFGYYKFQISRVLALYYS